MTDQYESFEQLLKQSEDLVKYGADEENLKHFSNKCGSFEWNAEKLAEFKENFNRLVDLMVLIGEKYRRNTAEETKATRTAISDSFLKCIQEPLRKVLLEENSELADQSSIGKGWIKVMEKVYETGCPTLLSGIRSTLQSDDLLVLNTSVMTRLLKVVRVNHSLLSVEVPETEDTLELGSYNDYVVKLFNEMVNSSNKNENHLNSSELMELVHEFFKICEEKMKDSPYKASNDENQPRREAQELHVYSVIYKTILKEIYFENFDDGCKMISEIRSMKMCHDKDIAALCSSFVDSKENQNNHGESLGELVKRYAPDPSKDLHGVILPDIVLNTYKNDPQMVKSVLPTLAKLIPSLKGHRNLIHRYKLCALLKSLAEQDVELITEDVIKYICTLTNEESLASIVAETLEIVAEKKPEIIGENLKEMIQFVTEAPLYIENIMKVFRKLTHHPEPKPDWVRVILAWLIPELMKPKWKASKPMMLKRAAEIGLSHKDKLLPYKAQMQQIISDLHEMKETIAEAKAVLKELERKKLALRVDATEEEIKALEKRYNEGVSELEEVKRKTGKCTPEWAPKVAKKMSEEDERERDWRLLALRLGYKREQLTEWLQSDQKKGEGCMQFLHDWFAKYDLSEARRALYIALHELDRMDAANIVGDEIKKAGEILPLDKPILFDDPPSVFISYQWSMQQNAIKLNNWLSECGFTCWMDIGQMGGGQELNEKIDTGIRSAKVVVMLITTKYAMSPNCKNEVTLANTQDKDVIPLMMEKMEWPPEGSIGPILAGRLYVRFYQRDEEKNDKFYWPEMKIVELIMQILYRITPKAELITKAKDDWWCELNGTSIIARSLTPKPAIFISYQWGKQNEIRKLKDELSKLEYDYWLDIERMGGGDNLYYKIDQGLRECKVMISCVTEKYAVSENCRRELNLASELKTKVIPLKLDGGSWPPKGPMGPILSELEPIVMTNGIDSDGVESLHERLKVELRSSDENLQHTTLRSTNYYITANEIKFKTPNGVSVIELENTDCVRTVCQKIKAINNSYKVSFAAQDGTTLIPSYSISDILEEHSSILLKINSTETVLKSRVPSSQCCTIV